MSSSKRSAFDFLMSGARAAAAKKKPQSSSSSNSSPKKRKTLDSNSTQNPKNLKTTEEVTTGQSSEPKNEAKCNNDINDSEKKPQEPAKEDVGNNDGTTASKKMRIVSSQEKIAELKKKISLLKKKPGDFDPSSIACWEKGEPVPFLFLGLAFDMISEESGRIVITDIVCNMLRTVMYTTPDDLLAAVYLSANKIAPAHEGLELGIGDASIIKALAEACGRTETQIKNQYKVIFLWGFSFYSRFFVPKFCFITVLL